MVGALVVGSSDDLRKVVDRAVGQIVNPAKVKERMVDQLMDSIGRDDYITRILVHFAEEKLRDESGWKIENDIVSVAAELFNRDD